MHRNWIAPEQAASDDRLFGHNLVLRLMIMIFILEHQNLVQRIANSSNTPPGRGTSTPTLAIMYLIFSLSVQNLVL